MGKPDDDNDTVQDDPFAACLPSSSGEQARNAVTKISPVYENPAPPSQRVSALDDIDIVVERVVNRIVKETLTPLIERARLSSEKKLDRLQTTLEGLVKELVEARAGDEEFEHVVEARDQGEQGEQERGQGEENDHERLNAENSENSENGPSTAAPNTIEDVEALRVGLQALMRENEERMRLLDERLQATAMPPPPPPPPPPPSRQYAPASSPPPQNFQHVSPHPVDMHGGYARRIHTAPPPPPAPQQAGVPIERVIDDIAVMGFSREEVRNVLRELTAQGKPVDMNCVLDRLSG